MNYRIYQVAYIPPSNDASLTQDIPGPNDTGYSSTQTLHFDDVSTIPDIENFVEDQYIYVRGEYMKIVSRRDTNNDTVDVERGSFTTPPSFHDKSESVWVGALNERELRHLEDLSDYDVDSVGSIEQTMELEKAKFRISNTSVTLKNVSRNQFSDAGSIHRPWVFEIEDAGGNVVFSGMIDSKSISYTAENRTTSFDVISWLELLDRAESVPARYIYETKVAAAYNSQHKNSFFDTNQRTIQVKLNAPDNMPGIVGSAGDILVVETDDAEIRAPIVYRNADDGQPVVMVYQDEQQDDAEIVYQHPQSGLEKKVREIKHGGGFLKDAHYTYRVQDDEFIRDIVQYSENDASHQDLEPGDRITFPDGYSVQVGLFDTGPTGSSADLMLARERTDFKVSRGFFSWDNPLGLGNIALDVLRADVKMSFTAQGPLAVVVQIREKDTVSLLNDKIKNGDTVRILGESVYGYDGEQYDVTINTASNGDFTRSIATHYDTKKIVKNLFQVNDLSQGRTKTGVLRHVFDGSGFDSVNSGKSPDDLESEIEYPEEGLKSLRQIQQKGRFLLKETFTNRTNSDGEPIPGYAPEMQLRENMFDTATTVSNEKIKSWEEDPVENRTTAVVVKPNEEYFKGRAGAGVENRYGFYFEGIEKFEQDGAEQDRQLIGVPEGDDVIELEMPVLPSDEVGYIYRGGDNTENNPKLKKIAKFYYDHFTKASREVTLTFGNDEPDWMGGYWYFQDQGRIIDDLVFVTRATKEVKSNSIDTELKGRIGVEAGQIDEAAPVARISGPREFQAADSNGNVRVSLNGGRSFALSGGTLSYEWERKPVGGSYSTVQTQGQLLSDEITGVTSVERYVYRLTVTSAKTGLTDSVEKEIVVGPDTKEPGAVITRTDTTSKKWQQKIGSDKYGFLLVHPRDVATVEEVSTRTEAGGNIPNGRFFSSINRHTDTIDAISTSNDKIRIAAVRNEHYEDVRVIELNDGSGNYTTFRVSGVSLDVSDTIISLEDSISSTGYTEVRAPFYVETVALSKKHTSAIEARVNYTNREDQKTFSHTYDFDNLAEVSNLAVYTDSDGNVKVDVQVDEDTDEYLLEYAINDSDGSGGWTTVVNGNADNKFTSDINNYDTGVTISNGDNCTIRVTPENVDDVVGKQVLLTTHYGKTSGTSVFDSITISGAGTIDSVQTDEFRFQDTGGNPATITGLTKIEWQEGLLQDGSGSYLELLAPNGTNNGELHVKKIVVDQLDVTGDVNQQNENNLAVEDRWLELNVGGGDQNGGLRYNRSSTDTLIMWEEGVDRWGTKLDGGTFSPFLLPDETATITSQWEFDAVINLDNHLYFSDTLESDNYVSGFGGSGIIIDGSNNLIETTDLSVRGTLTAREFEIRKIQQTKGPQVVGVGGSKVDAVTDKDIGTSHAITAVDTTADTFTVSGDQTADFPAGDIFVVEGSTGKDGDYEVSSSSYVAPSDETTITVVGDITDGTADGTIWLRNVVEISFTDDHGFLDSGSSPEPDFVLTQEVSAGDGSVVYQRDGRVYDVIDASTAQIDYAVGDNGKVPSVGDDVVQVASTDTDRDAMLLLNPYIPALDVFDGLNSLSDWENRTPKLRLGKIDGAPNLNSGVMTSGYGLWSDTAYVDKVNATTLAVGTSTGDTSSAALHVEGGNLVVGDSDNSDDDIFIYGKIEGPNAEMNFRSNHADWNPKSSGVDFRFRDDGNRDIFRVEEQGGFNARKYVGGDATVHSVATFAINATSTPSNGFGSYIALAWDREADQNSLRDATRFGSYITSGADTLADTSGAFITVRDDDTYRRVLDIDNEGRHVFGTSNYTPEHYFHGGIQVEGTAKIGAWLKIGQDYLIISNESDYYLGGGNTPDASSTGVHLEASSNPSDGSAMFVVESTGGKERLRVEHNGEVYTDNDLRTTSGIVYLGSGNHASYVDSATLRHNVTGTGGWIVDDGSSSSTIRQDPDSKITFSFVVTTQEFESNGDVIIKGGLTENGAPSDRRLKKNLTQTSPLPLFRDLDFWKYEWREKAKLDGRGRGLIAQDLLGSMPWAVNEHRDGYLRIDRLSLVQPTVAAVAGLVDRTDEHESRISELEQENQQLRSRIQDLESNHE